MNDTGLGASDISTTTIDGEVWEDVEIRDDNGAIEMRDDVTIEMRDDVTIEMRDDVMIEMRDMPGNPQSPNLPGEGMPPILPDESSTLTGGIPPILDKVPTAFETWMFKSRPKMKPFPWLHFPFFTISVTIVDIALMIWVISINGFAPPSTNWMLGPSGQTLIDAGAKVTHLILAGQGWRLLSAMFLHVGILHLLFNLLVQISFGFILERRYDCIRVAVVYLASGIGGNVMSAIFVPQFATVGASGALFGLIAMWTVMLFQDYHDILHPMVAIVSTLFFIVFSFVMGLLPYTDNFAHLGGFVTGLFLSIAIIPKLTHNPRWKLRGRIILSAVFAILFLVTFIGLFVVLYKAPPATEWCPGCSSFNCIGSDEWCGLSVRTSGAD